MGCASSAQPSENNPVAVTDEGGNDKDGKKIKKAARRDSIAVHKKHLERAATLDDRAAPAGMNVERYD